MSMSGGKEVKIKSSLNDKTLASLQVLFFNFLPGWTLFCEEMISFLIVTVGAGLSQSIRL